RNRPVAPVGATGLFVIAGSQDPFGADAFRHGVAVGVLRLGGACRNAMASPERASGSTRRPPAEA
ncbi:hypothetical protein, partial [Saccharopolyspora erythraea]|uniref:hypothetical protein n=1 Tax=Saccharopolyspora erythraea TaxID=1836 RepID=UPI001EE65258